MSTARIITLALGAVLILGFISVLFGNRKWDLDALESPWGDRPSIYEHVRAHIQSGKPGLTKAGEDLPDADQVFEEGGIRWVSGAMDGVLGGAGDPRAKKKAAKGVLGLLKKVLKDPSQENMDSFYTKVKAESAMGYVDPLLDLLVKESKIDEERFHDLALWLATRAADREPVKLGIVMLGIISGPTDRAVLLELGRHEEFTVYASVALMNSEQGSEQDLWELAKNVMGWGRVQLVERLAETKDPRIQTWLVREGYKNAIMYEYLAVICARAGKLHELLDVDSGDLDDEVFEAAGDLIQAMITGGPAEDIDDYQYSAQVVAHYLGHAQKRPLEVRHLLKVQTILQFLESDDGWEKRLESGWTGELRARLLQEAKGLVGQPGWKDKVLAQLESSDDQLFFDASMAAKALGLDVWGYHFRRLEQGKNEWFFVMKTDDRSRAEKVVSLAEKTLPLDKIATGPARELGLGEKYQAHGQLVFVLQELGRFEGLGWPLISTGLRSPVVNNRNMALKALAAWSRDKWPSDAELVLRRAAADEPDEGLKDRMSKVLAGEKLEEPKFHFPAE